MSFRIYLYMKLQVFIHGIDVIKDVMCNSRNDSHELRVVQLPLRTQTQTVNLESLAQVPERSEPCPNTPSSSRPLWTCLLLGGAFAWYKCTEKVAEQLEALALLTRWSTYFFCQLLPFAKHAVLPLFTLSLSDQREMNKHKQRYKLQPGSPS